MLDFDTLIIVNKKKKQIIIKLSSGTWKNKLYVAEP